MRADDAGFLRGEGAFETFRLVGGRPVGWSRHEARLRETLAWLGIPAPSLAEVPDQAAELARRHGATGEARARLTVTAGCAGAPTVVLTATALDADDLARRRRGVRLRSVAAARPLPERKLLGRVVEARAAREADAQEPGAEALLVDAAGVATETTTACVLGWTPTGLVVPETGLWGIGRAVVLDAAARLGLPVERRPLPVAAVAAGALVTNALIRIAPVLSLDGVAVAPPPAWVSRLVEVFDEVADA
ncbi:MAG: aminotransferase class IV [Myxococcales bacterium]|nr:aminotransferase class IV [Myxococcales bacterium]